jgi:hypothetical protein
LCIFQLMDNVKVEVPIQLQHRVLPQVILPRITTRRITESKSLPSLNITIKIIILTGALKCVVFLDRSINEFN